MPNIQHGGSTSFSPGGGMNVSSQISGLESINVPQLDLSGLRYLAPQAQASRPLYAPQQPAAPVPPRPDPVQYRQGITPQGVMYRIAENGPQAGQVQFTGGNPEQYGWYMGQDPGYATRMGGGGR